MIASSGQDRKGENQTAAPSCFTAFDDPKKDWKKFKDQIQDLHNKQCLALLGIILTGCLLGLVYAWVFGGELASDVVYWFISAVAGIGASMAAFHHEWSKWVFQKYGFTEEMWRQWVKEIDQLEPMEEKEALELLERCYEEGLTDTPEFQCCWNLREQLGYWPVLFRKMTSVLGAEASVSFKLKALEGLIEPTASQPSPEREKRENRLKLPLELARQAQSTSKP